MDKRSPPRRAWWCLCPIAAASAALLGAANANAVEIDVGNPDVALRWDNAVKYSAAARLKTADPVLLSNPNNDESDRNFEKELISSRLDWLTEADLFTGKVVMLTGFTLAIGGVTWVAGPIKFQADMDLLLAFMFLWNMLGALMLLPALAHFLLQPRPPRKSATRRLTGELA